MNWSQEGLRSVRRQIARPRASAVRLEFPGAKRGPCWGNHLIIISGSLAFPRLTKCNSSGGNFETTTRSRKLPRAWGRDCRRQRRSFPDSLLEKKKLSFPLGLWFPMMLARDISIRKQPPMRGLTLGAPASQHRNQKISAKYDKRKDRLPTL